MSLSPLLPAPTILERLREIFPPGSPHRDRSATTVCSRTIFVMLYIGALDASETYIRPDQVTRMTDAQAAMTSDAERLAWKSASMAKGKKSIPGRWYQDNSRETIRDEALRDGLLVVGAAVRLGNMPPNSSKPRWALEPEFAKLFDPNLSGPALQNAMDAWRSKHLTAAALARIAILRKGASKSKSKVLVTLPSGESRLMSPGTSSIITKAVIEEFAPRFLKDPAVIWVSESGNRVVASDDELAKSIGLVIDPQQALPDIILADVGPHDAVLMFVEVVATDGPISEPRKEALVEIAEEGGFDAARVMLMTAYLDRSRPEFKRTVNKLAVGSFAWFAGEPEMVMHLRPGAENASLYGHATSD